MARLTILTAPDPRLKERAGPVDTIDQSLRDLLDDMLETMYGANGIGLAAPQVGVLKRIIVVDVSPKDEDRAPIRMINPEILRASSDRATREEGCLSLPEQWADVTRPTTVTVRYLDEAGETRELDADGMLATCIQHEMDHLDGTLFVDHVSALKRGIILRRLKKRKRNGEA